MEWLRTRANANTLNGENVHMRSGRWLLVVGFCKFFERC